MWFKKQAKKKRDEPPVDNSRSEPFYELRKETVWNKTTAQEVPYHLYFGYKVTRDNGSSYTHGWSNGYSSDLSLIASGDKEWAQRTAEHYGIRMP